MTFTKSKVHPLNRIYERLRKRSYRRMRTSEFTWSGDWGSLDHAAYVNGLHDALAEVDKKKT